MGFGYPSPMLVYNGNQENNNDSSINYLKRSFDEIKDDKKYHSKKRANTRDRRSNEYKNKAIKMWQDAKYRNNIHGIQEIVKELFDVVCFYLCGWLFFLLFHFSVIVLDCLSYLGFAKFLALLLFGCILLI